MNFSPDADCEMVKKALQGNFEAIRSYHEEFREKLEIIVYTKSDKYIKNEFLKVVESAEEITKIKYKGREY